jgi:hypothetical protein
MKQQNTSFWDDAPFQIDNNNGIRMHSIAYKKHLRKDNPSESSAYKILMDEAAALNSDLILEETNS